MLSFHCGPGGNHNGIGDFMHTLDDAGIPFGLKSADHYGPIFEAANIARASGIRHTLVFRLTTVGQGNVYNFDVPDYGLSPAAAALKHWQATLNRLPPEFDKELVWLEVINEVDKNRSDWLGHFGADIAALAMNSGYKVALFGWSAGEPEASHWRTPGMVRFLKVAAVQPDRVAVALHEYSYEPDDLVSAFPHKIGRFRLLFDACAQENIARPTVLITEFGWTHEEVPPPEVATPQLQWAHDLYYPYPNIRVVALWYLGAGYAGIAHLAQKLIAPITEIELADGPVEPPPDPDPCSGGARVPYNREYWVIPQNASIARATQIFQAGYANRRTVGYSYDDAGIGHGLGGKKAVLWDIPVSSRQEFSDFYQQHYPDTQVEFLPAGPPPTPLPGNALLGLHAGADSGDLSEAEFSEFRLTRPGVIKVLSSHAGPSVARLAAEHPHAPFIVRAFLDFGGRIISAPQFFDDTIEDVERAVEAIGSGREIWLEIHNEPNLYVEGYGTSWDSGIAFAGWFLSALQRFRAALPGVKMLFPGLSPGPAVPGVRAAQTTFLNQSSLAIGQADGLAFHAYWQDAVNTPYPMSVALMEVDWHLSQYPNKPLWITESSNNGHTTAQARGNQYLTFWNELRKPGRAGIKGVTYFVASGSSYQEEAWVAADGTSKGIGAIVGSRVQ